MQLSEVSAGEVNELHSHSTICWHSPAQRPVLVVLPVIERMAAPSDPNATAGLPNLAGWEVAFRDAW